MGIENIFQDVIKALNAVNESNLKLLDATERLAGLRVGAIETVKTSAAPAEKPAAKKAEPKTIVETAKEVGAMAPTQEEKAAAVTAAAQSHPVGKLVLQYVGSGYDETHAEAAKERAERVARVKGLYAKVAEAAKVEINKYGEIPEIYHPKVIEALTKWIEGPALVIKAEAGSLDL